MHVDFMGSYTVEEIDNLLNNYKITGEEALRMKLEIRAEEKEKANPGGIVTDTYTADAIAQKEASNNAMLAQRARAAVANITPDTGEAQKAALIKIAEESTALESQSFLKAQKTKEILNQVIADPAAAAAVLKANAITSVNIPGTGNTNAAVSDLTAQLSPINKKLLIGGLVAAGLVTILLIRK
jgi:hypothetical protein